MTEEAETPKTMGHLSLLPIPPHPWAGWAQGWAHPAHPSMGLSLLPIPQKLSLLPIPPPSCIKASHGKIFT